MRGLILCLLALVLALPTYADEVGHSRAITKEFQIFYRFDSTKIDPEYSANAETIQLLKEYLQQNQSPDSIIIYAGSSPEGAYAYNAKLSEKRAEAAREYILRNNTGLDPDKIRIVSLAENWSGLLKLVEENYFRSDREKLIAILKAEGISDATREWRLQRLDDGYTWSYLKRKYMPQLRSATWICVTIQYTNPIPSVSALCTKAVTATGPATRKTDERKVVTPQTEEPQIPLLAIRTNLLLPALNAGVEVPLGNSWSVSADYYWPWFWPSKSNRNCLEMLAWSLEGRYWFGRDRKPQDRLRGHSVGLYAAGGYYDFERNYKGIQGEFVSTGLDYTYSMGIGRKQRLNLELSLAFGYIHSRNKTYSVPWDGGALYPDDGTMMFDYFGPTKAAVSLVIPIYRKEGRK